MPIPKTNGDAVRENAWRLVTALTLAGVIGTATMLWDISGRLRVIEATMVTERELTITLQENVPPSWFREQVQRIDSNLTTHMRQTTSQAHTGGGK